MYYDLIDLRLLVATADAGSLSRAAAEFPIALSAASNRLRQFEQRCGITLFLRNAGGMAPTPSGKIVLEHARRVLAESEQLRSALADLAGRRRIQIRLAANTVASSTFLPAALGPFLADYPDIDLQLEERSSRDVLQAVLSEEADIGVLDGNLPLAGVESMPFRQDRLVLLVPDAHSLAARGHCLLREALGFAFVGLPPERAMQRFVEDMAGRNGKPLTMRVRAPSFFALAQLVAQGVGIAVLPEAAVRRLAGSLPAAVVMLDDAWATRELRLCVLSMEGLSAQARQLLAYLADNDGAAA